MARQAVRYNRFNGGAIAILSVLCSVGCTTNGQADAAKLQESETFSVASDPTLEFPTREQAALKLDDSQRVRLRELLLSRVPDSWSATTKRDLFVLGDIGDEGTAATLSGLYLAVPDVAVAGEEMPKVLHTSVAMIWNRLGTHAREIVGDSNVYVSDRIIATRRLTEKERAEISNILVARVDDKWDTLVAMDDSSVLGEIGDENTAQQLERIYTTYESRGKVSAVAREAVNRIRSRLASSH